MTKIIFRVLCLLTVLVLAPPLSSFASDDPGSSQLKVFRGRFNTMQADAENLWIRMESASSDDNAGIRLLMEESNALSRRFLEFGREVQMFDLTRQQVHKKRFADSDAFLFLGAAASEMTNLLSSRIDFMTNRRAIFLTAANKHQEIVEMFVKASQNAEVLNR